MKHLIVYTHLNPESFTKAVTDKVESLAMAKGEDVEVIDLYADGFNPVLGYSDIESMFMGKETSDEILAYQEKVSWANHVTFIYPLWWGQMPAMLKGFIDRVFANGFAFEYGAEGPKGLLGEKTVRLIINMGTPKEIHEATGMIAAQERINNGGIFEFCGMKSDITFFGNVTMGTDEDRKGYLTSLEKL